MSEQTDPLAQLILDHRERHPLVGICRCGDFDVHDGYPSHLADAIRAAVLADPTIVGMERDEPDGDWYCEAIACYATVNHDGERCPMHGGSATPLYQTPEVKG